MSYVWAVVALSLLACGGRAVRSDPDPNETGPDECLVGVRLDACCDDPVVVRQSNLDRDPCLVRWSHRNSVPQRQLAACKSQTEGCDSVRCTTPPVPSRIAAPAADSSCQFANECESDLDCALARDASQFCGCQEAHSIVEIEAEGCLFSESQMPGECLVPLCGVAGPCPTCPVCISSVPARCTVGELGLRVCGPPFDGFPSF